MCLLTGCRILSRAEKYGQREVRPPFKDIHKTCRVSLLFIGNYQSNNKKIDLHIILARSVGVRLIKVTCLIFMPSDTHFVITKLQYTIRFAFSLQFLKQMTRIGWSTQALKRTRSREGGQIPLTYNPHSSHR